MTLEGILTIIGILIAIAALADPVQRLSFRLILPWPLAVGGLLFTLLIVFAQDIIDRGLLGNRWSGWPILGNAAIVYVLFCVAVEGYRAWQKGILPPRHLRQLGTVLKTALLENKLNEAERILRANQTQLHTIDEEAHLLLFDRRLIKAFTDVRSPFHLELLENGAFLNAAPQRFREVELVIRELLLNDNSALRSVITERAAADEHHHASPTESQLIDRTFFTPVWYRSTNAHYPLVITAIEEIQSGRYDEEYNQNGRRYGATQGRSRRATCPLYHAQQTHVMALTEALIQYYEKDLYVTDLHDLFRAVLERSRYDERVWESDLTNSECPTPYAYLLYTINGDLRKLAECAVQKATPELSKEHLTIRSPGLLAQAIALTWSFCTWTIARNSGKVSSDFRDSRIESYLVFVLQLGWECSEIYYHPLHPPMGLITWRDLFADSLRERLAGSPQEQARISTVISTLDFGKQYVQKGRGWLLQRLGLPSGN